MKNYLIIISLFIISLNEVSSQNLNIKFFEQIVKQKYSEIEDLMVNGYGFMNWNEDNPLKNKKFFLIKGDDIDFAISINIVNSFKEGQNALDILVAKGYSINEFKSNLLDNGYLYYGTKNNFLGYIKGKLLVQIDKNTNPKGATQILISYF